MYSYFIWSVRKFLSVLKGKKFMSLAYLYHDTYIDDCLKEGRLAKYLSSNPFVDHTDIVTLEQV